jgi:phosphatidylserine/phosphatidylglycerophosphate/cardiolipin synthase-like enzyme
MTTVSEVVLHLVDDLPKEHVTHLVDLLRAEASLDWARLSHRLRIAIPQLDTQERVRNFISEWQDLVQPPTPSEMSLLLESVYAALAYQRQKQKIELTWTGPRSSQVSLRRTDQALIELINSAREKILIVSFVVYKALTILAALERAADRSVEITIVLESPDVEEGKVAFSAISALGASLRARSKVYIWPTTKRAMTPEGKTGSLHAKLGVADGNCLYLSSANLTEYAMNINMEMGVLIQGGDLPAQVVGHFEELINLGYLERINPSTL